MSRIKNVTRNTIFSFMNNFLSNLINFINRTLFIYLLSAEYLGLNGLFINVLGVLSLADLGISSAITFSLYKPIATHDNKKIGQIVNFLGKAYKIIGFVILLVGLLLIPFLKYFVNFDSKININYYVIYLLFLINSVCTYLFFSYKNTVIYAAQKAYLTAKYEMICTIIILVLQVIVLIFTKNYYIYLTVPIILNILRNYKISKVAEKLYPDIKKSGKEKLTEKDRKDLFKNIYSLSMIKISGVIYSSTDNLIISSMIGTLFVGFYSNYLMIINIVKQFVAILFNSMTASVGDLNVSETAEYKYCIFKKLNLFNGLVYGYCFTCLLHLSNPFITFWIGKKYLFGERTVLLICLIFLIPGLNNIINIYNDGCGLFWETRYRTLATALINIISSIILTKYIGIDGVFLGTIIAYLTTIYIIDPYTVFSKVFKKNVCVYYKQLILMILFIVFNNFLIRVVSFFFNISSLYSIIIYLIIMSIIYALNCFIFFYRTKEFKELLNTISEIISMLKKL